MTVLFVVATIVLFLGLDWLIQRRKKTPELAVAAPEPAPVRLPAGVFFSPSHTWVNLFPSGRAWLGVDDFVTRLLEKPTVAFLKPVGAAVEKGEPLFRLQEGEHSLTVRSPFKGRVLAQNDAIARREGALARAAFFDGWIYELRPERGADLKALHLGDETRSWMQTEFGRLRDLFAGATPELQPAMLQDGGPPVAGAMKHVSPETWKKFEDEFLAVR